MDITEIPFNRHIGIKKCASSETALLQLDKSDSLVNHLNTVHASAQFALAEAAGGERLLRRFMDVASKGTFVPVVRDVLVKYRKPANGTLRAAADISDTDAAKALETLARKGRAVIPVEVAVIDEAGSTTMSATFSWFIQKID